jgi:hypothetical protein
MNNLQTFKAIRALGMAVSHNEGEWRIDYRRGDSRKTNDSCYYTDSREDALGTAKLMAEYKNEITNAI